MRTARPEITGSKIPTLALYRAHTRLTARWIAKAMTTVAVSMLILSTTTASSTLVAAWQADVPLNQALVLAGGESTNPRSFDPSLRLTPDLAERWEVRPDGDVLFHSESPQNNGGYSNPQLDRLLEAGRVEQDVTKHIEIYPQCACIVSMSYLGRVPARAGGA